MANSDTIKEVALTPHSEDASNGSINLVSMSLGMTVAEPTLMFHDHDTDAIIQFNPVPMLALDSCDSNQLSYTGTVITKDDKWPAPKSAEISALFSKAVGQFDLRSLAHQAQLATSLQQAVPTTVDANMDSFMATIKVADAETTGIAGLTAHPVLLAIHASPEMIGVCVEVLRKQLIAITLLQSSEATTVNTTH